MAFPWRWLSLKFVTSAQVAITIITLYIKKKVKSLISSYLRTFGRDTKWGHHLNFFFSLFIIKTNGFHVTMGDHRRLWNNIGDTFGCTWVPCVCSHHFLTSYDLLLNRYTAILNLAVFKKSKSETKKRWNRRSDNPNLTQHIYFRVTVSFVCKKFGTVTWHLLNSSKKASLWPSKVWSHFLITPSNWNMNMAW